MRPALSLCAWTLICTLSIFQSIATILCYYNLINESHKKRHELSLLLFYILYKLQFKLLWMQNGKQTIGENKQNVYLCWVNDLVKIFLFYVHNFFIIVSFNRTKKYFFWNLNTENTRKVGHKLRLAFILKILLHESSKPEQFSKYIRSLRKQVWEV